MKTILLLLAVTGCGLSPSKSATLLLDDFSSGAFALAFGGTTSNSSSFATALTDQRTISGVGDPNWTATLSAGSLVYVVDSMSKGRNYLTMNYSSTGVFSILGYNAFALDLLNVIGTGELIVSVTGSGGNNIKVPISGSGTIVSPFSFLDTSQPLDSLSAMNFRINAISEDFSADINNVRIIPEPSASILLLLSAAGLVLRRRRKN
jgi:hypothetical protein